MPIDFAQLNRDFQQRYEHTYVRVRLPNSKKKTIFLITGIQSTGNLPHLLLQNEEFGSVNLNYNTEADIFFDPPKTGYFFFNNQVALLYQRTCARQWKRGVSTGNSNIYSPYERNFFGASKFGLNEETLLSAYAGEGASFQDALTLLASKQALSVPINKDLAIGLNPTVGKSLIVWFHSHPVAEYIDKGSFIRMHENHFQQEISDYFTKARINVQIV